MAEEALPPARMSFSGRYLSWATFLLMVTLLLNLLDRSILNTVGQAVKEDLQLTDLQLGLLGGAAFGVLNALAALPIARLADRYNRVRLIAFTLAIWSALTVVCGLAANVWQLALARCGLGVAETGSTPASLSLLFDYFPPQRRATVLGIFTLGSALGILIGAISSGFIAAHFGWRAAFMLVGAPGLALALLLFLTMREPPRGNTDVVAAVGGTPSTLEVMRGLVRRTSCVHIIVAATFVALGNYGAFQFLHPFFVRALGMSYFNAALLFGAVAGFGTGIGFGAGGAAADWAARFDERFYVWTPGFCVGAAGPVYALGLAFHSPAVCGALTLLASALAGMYWAPTYASINRATHVRGRATASAIITVCSSLVGLTAGPPLAGYLSDRFASAAYGAGDFSAACVHVAGGLANAACTAASGDGVRHALMIYTCVMYLGAGLHYFLAARTFRADLALSED